MLKRLLLITALLAITGTNIVKASPYIGITGGFVNNEGDRWMPASFSVGLAAMPTSAFYLAGELNGYLERVAAVTSTDADTGVTTTTQSASSTYGIGVAAIPGWMFSEQAMIYSRLGAVYSPNTTYGLQVGLGFQTKIAESWSVRGEYVYTSYDHFSDLSSDSRSDQFDIGFVYTIG